MFKKNLITEGKIKITKPIFILLLIPSVFLLLFLFSCSNAEEDASIGFDTIAKDFYSQKAQEENYVIKDTQGFNQLLDLVGNENLAVAVEDIDFSEEMVVAVFMGEKPTGGYSVEIQDVLKNKDNLEFLIKIEEPGPDDMVAQTITSPYHIIILERSDKEYVFTIVD